MPKKTKGLQSIYLIQGLFEGSGDSFIAGGCLMEHSDESLVKAKEFAQHLSAIHTEEGMRVLYGVKVVTNLNGVADESWRPLDARKSRKRKTLKGAKGAR